MMQLFGPSAAINSALAQATSGTGSNSPGSAASSSLNSLTSENTFLQLLIAQIKNQDPLNPTDSIQFVGQLVQYSELEQLMGINQGVTSLVNGITPTTPASGAQAHSSNSTSQTPSS